MNGVHDMGGMQCFGHVVVEENEPLFHEDWERTALALTVAAGFCGMWNLDWSRRTRENLPPVAYLSLSYYQIWIAALEKLLVETGMASARELESGTMEKAAISVKRVLDGEGMKAALAAGGPASREIKTGPRFGVGEQVKTVRFNPDGHTRLPRYARDAVGKIKTLRGAHVFPDSNAHQLGENPCHLYTVEFSAKELFGKDADENHFVCVDCWEPYLDRV